jgi:hypothetical protein
METNMAMRSALYYPHTDIRSETLMKSALLTWDRVHTIFPYKEYKPNYSGNIQSLTQKFLVLVMVV